MREMAIVYRTTPATRGILAGPIRSPRDAACLLDRILGEETVEVFGALLLNSRKRVLAWHEVARGSLDRVDVHPREVFKAALLANSACILLAHCHPSGDPEPSAEDQALTERLRHAGDLLGIEIVDHVVVGDGRYSSFRESGRL